jgi:hypothetical protein
MRERRIDQHKLSSPDGPMLDCVNDGWDRLSMHLVKLTMTVSKTGWRALLSRKPSDPYLGISGCCKDSAPVAEVNRVFGLSTAFLKQHHPPARQAADGRTIDLKKAWCPPRVQVFDGRRGDQADEPSRRKAAQHISRRPPQHAPFFAIARDFDTRCPRSITHRTGRAAALIIQPGPRNSRTACCPRYDARPSARSGEHAARHRGSDWVELSTSSRISY